MTQATHRHHRHRDHDRHHRSRSHPVPNGILSQNLRLVSIEHIPPLARILSLGPSPSLPSTTAQRRQYEQVTSSEIQSLNASLGKNKYLVELREKIRNGKRKLDPGRWDEKGDVRVGRHFCRVHASLNGELIGEIFNIIKVYVEVKIPHFLAALSTSLTTGHRIVFFALRGIEQLWMKESKYKLLNPEEKDFFKRFEPQPDGCTACILARLGGDKASVFALRTGMYACLRQRRHGARRMLWVDTWLGQVADDNLIHASTEMGMGLKKMWKRGRRGWEEEEEDDPNEVEGSHPQSQQDSGAARVGAYAPGREPVGYGAAARAQYHQHTFARNRDQHARPGVSDDRHTTEKQRLTHLLNLLFDDHPPTLLTELLGIQRQPQVDIRAQFRQPPATLHDPIPTHRGIPPEDDVQSQSSVYSQDVHGNPYALAEQPRGPDPIQQRHGTSTRMPFVHDDGPSSNSSESSPRERLAPLVGAPSILRPRAPSVVSSSQRTFVPARAGWRPPAHVQRPSPLSAANARSEHADLLNPNITWDAVSQATTRDREFAWEDEGDTSTSRGPRAPPDIRDERPPPAASAMSGGHTISEFIAQYVDPEVSNAIPPVPPRHRHDSVMIPRDEDDEEDRKSITTEILYGRRYGEPPPAHASERGRGQGEGEGKERRDSLANVRDEVDKLPVLHGPTLPPRERRERQDGVEMLRPRDERPVVVKLKDFRRKPVPPTNGGCEFWGEETPHSTDQDTRSVHSSTTEEPYQRRREGIEVESERGRQIREEQNRHENAEQDEPIETFRPLDFRRRQRETEREKQRDREAEVPKELRRKPVPPASSSGREQHERSQKHHSAPQAIPRAQDLREEVRSRLRRVARVNLREQPREVPREEARETIRQSPHQNSLEPTGPDAVDQFMQRLRGEPSRPSGRAEGRVERATTNPSRPLREGNLRQAVPAERRRAENGSSRPEAQGDDITREELLLLVPAVGDRRTRGSTMTQATRWSFFQQ